MDPLKLYLDTLEPRVRYESLNAIFTCSQSDILYSGTAISVDFVTDTGMLRPLPETPEWGSVFTGDYYRYRKADYTLVSPNAWVDKQVGTAGNYYLQSLNINEIVYTTQTWPVNQPVYLSWYVYGVGSERHVIMECGWTDPSNSVSLRYWSDGKVEVWKGGSVVGGGNIIDDVVYYANPYGSGYAPYSVKGRNQTLERIQVYMVPCRQRELLVLSNAGGGFNHAFDDLVIDPNIQTPGTVTESGRFWWLVPEGQAEVQFAPLKFKTAGTVWSAPLKLRYPPQTGSTVNYSLYWSGPGIGSVSAVGTVIDASSGSAFSANGTVDTVRLGMVLSGDGSATPYAYGMRATFSGSVTTAGTSSPFDATSYVLSDGLEVTCGEHYSGNRVEARLHSPGTMDLSYSGNGYALNNTSFEVRGGTSTPVVMAGRIDGQTWEEQGVGGQDRARLHTLTGRDWWKTFEGWPQVDPFPLDAFRLDVAIGTLVSLAGYGSAYQSISTVDFHLPSTPAASRGEWASMPETGETIADTLRRMHEDYAATHVMGWRPTSGGTPTFQFAGTAEIGTVASATVFPSLGSAQAAGYTVDPYRYVYTSYQERILEPEANDTWAIGRDPRTGTVIAAHYEDVVSQDPTLHAAARPDNWLGERRRYVLVDPSITEQVVANWAVATLGPRLAQTRYISQWECNDWLARTDGAPVWRGDVVQLADQGRFRVISAGLKTTYEGTVYDTVRRATYVGEWIGPPSGGWIIGQDTFTGGSANLSAHTPEIGPYWQQATSGTAIIDGLGNARALEQVAAASIRYRIVTPKTWRDMDVRSSMVLGSANIETGLLARYANDANRYEFVWANAATPGFRLYRRRMGTLTTLATYAMVSMVGATVDVALRCVGPNITAYIGGTAQTPIYDPSLMIAGYPGIQISNGTAPVSAMTLFRDFTCEAM